MDLGRARAALGRRPPISGLPEIGSLSAQVGQGATCGGSPGAEEAGRAPQGDGTVRCMWQSQRRICVITLSVTGVPERTLSSARLSAGITSAPSRPLPIAAARSHDFLEVG